jgi:hypothetical protein
MHEGGAVGYLYRLSVNRPDLFVHLLRRMLPVTVKAELESDSLASRLLSTIAAQRQAMLGGGTTIDLTPLPRSTADDRSKL